MRNLERIKVVLDTNVWVSWAISPNGTPARCVKLAESGFCRAYICREIVDEFMSKMAHKFRLSPTDIERLTELMCSIAHTVEISGLLRAMPEDPDDDKVIECAVVANADYIVTGDKDLLGLERYQSISIISPADFYQRIFRAGNSRSFQGDE